MSAWAKRASGIASCNVELFRMGLVQEPPSSGDLDAYPATGAG
ncbi:hypothetical protein PJ985_10425 [Streptomyces sp. ACA25]|nr:hypothetical protein [Streptomyces sp. ACA25]MDB1087981.1 hypothetical protein [Streptomyces sp. ACA25]